MILAEMAEGKTPTGSMGNDSALAALAEEPRRLTQYLHQLFAQVTNPPMDPIREQLVMSLRTYMGRRASMLSETDSTAHIVELSSPILSDAELSSIVRSSDPRFFSYWIAATWPSVEGAAGMSAAIHTDYGRGRRSGRRGSFSDRPVRSRGGRRQRSDSDGAGGRSHPSCVDRGRHSDQGFDDRCLR